MFKMKSRDLFGTQWGRSGLPLYCNVASGGTPAALCMNDQCTDFAVRQNWVDKMYKLNSTVPAKDYTGSERFGSTHIGRDRMNNCDHYRNRCVNYPFGGVLKKYLSTGAIRYGYYRWILFPSTLVQLDDVVSHPLLDYSEAQRTAWHIMQPEFEGNVSLINFIYELKDFRDIAKFIAKAPITTLGNRLRRTLSRLRRKPGYGTTWELTRPAAEAHLANEFAIKPLISDIMAISAQLYEIVREAQNQFQLDGHALNSRHYTEEMFNSGTTAQKYNTPYLLGNHYRTTFGATLKYKYSYVQRPTFDALAHFWGMKLTGEAMWNMIPFSFLLDYILGVGKAIKVMSHDKNVHTQIFDYAESLLTTDSSGYHIDCDVHPSRVLIDGKFRTGMSLISGSESTLYTRRVTVPNEGAVLPRIRRPNNKQALNASALLRVFL